jgi:hypothetical protein
MWIAVPMANALQEALQLARGFPGNTHLFNNLDCPLPDLAVETRRVVEADNARCDENPKEKTFSSLKILSFGDNALYVVGEEWRRGCVPLATGCNPP